MNPSLKEHLIQSIKLKKKKSVLRKAYSYYSIIIVAFEMLTMYFVLLCTAKVFCPYYLQNNQQSYFESSAHFPDFQHCQFLCLSSNPSMTKVSSNWNPLQSRMKLYSTQHALTISSAKSMVSAIFSIYLKLFQMFILHTYGPRLVNNLIFYFIWINDYLHKELLIS